MEEIKLLLQMVRDLPSMALWVIAFIFAYKVSVVGSIYGVLRLAIDKLHNWLVTPKHELRKVDVEMRGTIDGMCITGHSDALVSQLHRIRGKNTGIKSNYIHGTSVDWLREAIDAKEARDAEAAAAKAATA